MPSTLPSRRRGWHRRTAGPCMHQTLRLDRILPYLRRHGHVHDPWLQRKAPRPGTVAASSSVPVSTPPIPSEAQLHSVSSDRPTCSRDRRRCLSSSRRRGSPSARCICFRSLGPIPAALASVSSHLGHVDGPFPNPTPRNGQATSGRSAQINTGGAPPFP